MTDEPGREVTDASPGGGDEADDGLASDARVEYDAPSDGVDPAASMGAVASAGSSRELDGAAGQSTGAEDGLAALDIDDRHRQLLAWGGLAVCSLLALFALVQFYGSVTDAIDLWVDPEYQPFMHAAFNLAVLLAALAGVSVTLRDLSET